MMVNESKMAYLTLCYSIISPCNVDIYTHVVNDYFLYKADYSGNIFFQIVNFIIFLVNAITFNNFLIPVYPVQIFPMISCHTISINLKKSSSIF